MAESDPLVDLRIADVLTFLAVSRTGSMTAAARQVGVTPSQVSKAVARLEGQLSLPLLVRAARSVRLTDEGRSAAAELAFLVEHLRALRERGRGDVQSLSVAGPSDLLKHFLPAYAAGIAHKRLRGLEMAPSDILSLTTGTDFDLCLLLSDEPLPSSWTSVVVGSVLFGVVTTPATAELLGAAPVLPERLREHPFISPPAHARLAAGLDDECPMPLFERKQGHQVQTLSIGLDVAERTGQLFFIPLMTARAQLASARLVHVPVKGWNVRRPLRLCANRDRVLANTLRELMEISRRELEALQEPVDNEEACLQDA